MMHFNSKLALTVFLISTRSGAAFAAIPAPASPTMYYVSASSGNDSNDGLSPEKAWQHLSIIFRKSTSKDPFRAGDNILLRRGDRWDGQIRLQANGTSQRPVRIGAYGDGAKPAILGDNPQAHWEPIAGHVGIYTTDIGEGSIPGLIVLGGKVLKVIYPSGPLDSHEDIETFFARLELASSVGRLGDRLWVRMPEGSNLPNGTLRIFRNAGVSVANSSYIQIENLDIERFSTGIDITESKHVAVRHNDIQDVFGIGIYLRWGDSDCLVESNTVFRGGGTALYTLKGFRNTFRDNWVSYLKTNILGIQVGGDKMGVGLQESQKSLVEYNYYTHSGGMDFYHEDDSTVRYNYLHRVWSAGSPNGVNLSVYGNIYNLGAPSGKRGSTGINVGVTGPGTISVFNNTILNASSYSLMGTSDKGKIVFSDNIVSATTAAGAMTSFGSNVESNHNCFFTSREPLFVHFKAKFASMKAYQEQSGLDRDSIYADPQFASTMPITPLDFLVRPGSGCISKASDIPSFNATGGRTYDDDRGIAGSPIVGALHVDDVVRRVDTPSQSCTSQCFRHKFAVPPGVYIVSLKFAPAALSQQPKFTFVLNDRTFEVEFNPSAVAELDDALLRYFLVRPDGPSIMLETKEATDTSIVTEVNILRFDTSHGDGPQSTSW